MKKKNNFHLLKRKSVFDREIDKINLDVGQPHTADHVV